MILVRIEKITGTSKVEEYKDFFPIKSIGLGAESAMDLKGSGDDGAKRDFVVKKNREPEEVSISRWVDNVSPALMSLAIKNRTLSDSIFSKIDVSFLQWRTEVAHDGEKGVKAYLQLRFGGARLVSWKLDGDDQGRPEETIEFKYKQIAFRFRSTEEGTAYQSSSVQTWDFELNNTCNDLVPDWK